MPEGPSIVLLKEALNVFVDKKIIKVTGTSRKMDYGSLSSLKIKSIKTWGKHLLIVLPDVTIRIHLLMFGSYSIDTVKKDRIPKLSLFFLGNRSLHFYACAISLLYDPLKHLYDWTSDVLSKKWDPQKAISKLNTHPGVLVCDALLNQEIFAGSGNIIKNETLFRSKIHPLSKLGKLPSTVKKRMVNEVVVYSKLFLKWKRKNMLKRNWLAYAKKSCPRDHTPLTKEYLGRTQRRTFYCKKCQKLYK